MIENIDSLLCHLGRPDHMWDLAAVLESRQMVQKPSEKLLSKLSNSKSRAVLAYVIWFADDWQTLLNCFDSKDSAVTDEDRLILCEVLWLAMVEKDSALFDDVVAVFPPAKQFYAKKVCEKSQRSFCASTHELRHSKAHKAMLHAWRLVDLSFPTQYLSRILAQLDESDEFYGTIKADIRSCFDSDPETQAIRAQFRTKMAEVANR